MRTGRVSDDRRRAFLDLQHHFRAFYVSNLDGRQEYSRLFYFNSNNNPSKHGWTTRWTTRGWTNGTYTHVVTAELWVPGNELKIGVSVDALHEFKGDVLFLIEWINRNRHLFT